MNVRINSGKTKNPATAGLLLKSFGWGYFSSTIFLVWTNSPACILYRYTPALTHLESSEAIGSILDPTLQ